MSLAAHILGYWLLATAAIVALLYLNGTRLLRKYEHRRAVDIEIVVAFESKAIPDSPELIDDPREWSPRSPK